MSRLGQRVDDEQPTESDLRRLVEQQAALRRVATLMAQGASPADVFRSVAEEVALLLDTPTAAIDRYEPDGSSIVVGAWGDGPWQAGVRSPNEGPSLRSWVRDTGRPARVDHFNPDPAQDRPAHPGGRRSVGVGVPIVVDGHIWGAVLAGGFKPMTLPADSESRLAGFTELVAAAILNERVRDDLRESEGLYRETIAHAGAVPYVFSYAEDRYAFIGDGIEALTGYTAAEFTTDIFDEIVEETVPLNESARAGTDDALGHARFGGMRWRADQRIKTRSGEVRWISDTSVEIAGRDGRRVVGMLQDITERKRAEEEVRRLADEQAALRRVATLVAREASPTDVFAAVAHEAAALLTAPLVAMVRYEPDTTATVIAASREEPFPVGTNWTMDGPSIVALVLESGRPTRLDDYADVPGTIAERARGAGFQSAVGVPIQVDRKLWGAMVAVAPGAEPLPEDTESRLARFTELVAAAISNAQARDDLRASRARIVTTADEARLKIERDLHDGTQQQLVSLDLNLQLLEAKIESEPQEAHAELERARELLAAVLHDVREISRGVHPATLSQRGLGPALRALARRSVVPVEVDVDVDGRLPQSIEIAAYYVASEAIANVAKHADASLAAITVAATDSHLSVTVRDDGVGGAEAGPGSGLSGLVDRVEALGGDLKLESPPGEGTQVTVELPLGEQISTE